MEYFKKLWNLDIDQDTNRDIIDYPIYLQEVAILQDSVNKDILGRIKFVNFTKENIIAVFFNYRVEDISGEEIPLENNQYVYQDMCVKHGEMYGNKIAIELPDMARKLYVEITRVVFKDGKVWNVSEAERCPAFSIEKIVPPKKNFERVRNELSKKISQIDYVNYYYQENESAWLCTCGKINEINRDNCSFCDIPKSIQKDLLTKENYKSFCSSVDAIVEKEEEEALKKAEIAQKEAEAEKAKREQEELERKKKQEEEEELRKKELKRKNYITAGMLAVVAIALVVGIIIFTNIQNQPAFESEEAMVESVSGFYVRYNDDKPTESLSIYADTERVIRSGYAANDHDVYGIVEWDPEEGIIKLSNSNNDTSTNKNSSNNDNDITTHKNGSIDFKGNTFEKES